MAEDLEKCPFCEGDGELRWNSLDERFSYGREAWVVCKVCGGRTKSFFHDEKPGYAIPETANPKAIEAWNKRPKPVSPS